MYSVSGERVCECSGRMEFDYEKGELVCTRCGLVYENNIDLGPDYRNFSDGPNRSHNGPARKETDIGENTEIPYTSRDANGGRISQSTQSTMRRLRIAQKRAMLDNGAKRSLKTAKTDIENIAGTMGLSSLVVDTTFHDYKILVRSAGLRGRSVKLTVAALIYGSCRKCNVPRTLDEVCKASKISRRDIGRAFRHISKVLKYEVKLTDPSAYLDRFCSKLDLPQEVARTASSMIDGKRDMFVGKSPVSIAAAAVYLAASKKSIRRTQTQIANVAGVTEVTIRKICREMTA